MLWKSSELSLMSLENVAQSSYKNIQWDRKKSFLNDIMLYEVSIP